MSTDLARWQFATTSIYHFLFVPLTIGLAFLVALLQTSYYRNQNPIFKRLTKFFGTLLLINVAIGVVTGLVQEFEFGMNWSTYSQYVGNIFGGPLAMEGLAAFFVESTFLGLWIFGWDRLSKKVHLACIWVVAGATMLSAMFIMAANSWMQHPVGYTLDSHGKPQLTNIWALFTNPVFLWGYTHVVLASLVTGSVVMLAFSAWHLKRKNSVDAFRRTAIIALVVLLPAITLNLFVGSELGVQEGKYQPMKIAAAEALWNTCPSHCSFSLFQIGGGNNDMTPTQILEVPDLLSILATNHVDGEVQGMNQLQAQYTKQYGPGNYVPNVFIQYWSMRVMAYLGAAVMLFALWGAWLLRKKKLDQGQVVPACRALGGRGAVPHEHGRLAPDRERAPTLDRAGSPEDGPGGLAVGHHHRHRHQPDCLRPHLHRPGHRRRLSHDPLRPPGARTGWTKVVNVLPRIWAAAPRANKAAPPTAHRTNRRANVSRLSCTRRLACI